MVGKKIALLAAALVLAGCSIAEAALTDGVRDMLLNHRYVATYKQKMRSLGDDVQQPGSTYDMWEHTKVALGEDGQKKLLMETIDMSAMSSYDPVQLTYIVADGTNTDVATYAGKPGKLKFQKTPKSMKEAEIAAARQNMDVRFDTTGFLFYFMPLLPDQNRTATGGEGASAYAYRNVCTLYNGSGSQTIGGKEYQYEEYVPDPSIWGEYLPKSSIRYYFDQGDLKLVIYVYTTEQDGKSYSTYQSLMLDRFTSTFDESLFTLPTDKEMSESDVKGIDMKP